MNDNTRMYHNSKAREGLLNAQKKPPQSGVPKKQQSPIRRNGSVPPRNAVSKTQLTA